MTILTDGQEHCLMESREDTPTIIQFRSVSNDEMETNSSFHLSLDESHLFPNLKIDTTALKPENRAPSPIFDCLETPTFSYCRVPQWKLDEQVLSHNKASSAAAAPPFTSSFQPVAGFTYPPRPSSRSSNFPPPAPMSHCSGHNSYTARNDSTESNYRPFLSEDFSIALDESSNLESMGQMKRKLPSPYEGLTANKRTAIATDFYHNFMSDGNSNVDQMFQLDYQLAPTSLSLFPLPPAAPISSVMMSSSTTPLPTPATEGVSSSSVILLRSSTAPQCIFHLSPQSPEETACVSLDSFIIYDKIGSGVDSEVFQCEVLGSPNLGYFALKKLRKLLKTNKQEEKACQELHILYQLNEFQCPNIPQLYVAWKEDQMLYCLMEYAEHGTLKQLYDYHVQTAFQITLPYVWYVVSSVAAALEFLHAQELVHLDIKAGNLLIFAEGRVKVGDFGLATKAGPTIEDPEGDSRYLPSELLNSDERTYSADIFSLGMVIYEMVQLLFSFESNQLPLSKAPDLLPENGPFWLQLRSGDIPFPENSPKVFTALIPRMLHPQPEQRPTATDLRRLPEVVEVEQQPQLYLQAWESVCFVQPTHIKNRTASYDPSMNLPPTK